MAKQKLKSDLPQKICPICRLSFSWRKKWAKCWDEVKYCSEKCRRHRNSKLEINLGDYGDKNPLN